MLGRPHRRWAPAVGATLLIMSWLSLGAPAGAVTGAADPPPAPAGAHCHDEPASTPAPPPEPAPVMEPESLAPSAVEPEAPAAAEPAPEMATMVMRAAPAEPEPDAAVAPPDDRGPATAPGQPASPDRAPEVPAAPRPPSSVDDGVRPGGPVQRHAPEPAAPAAARAPAAPEQAPTPEVRTEMPPRGREATPPDRVRRTRSRAAHPRRDVHEVGAGSRARRVAAAMMPRPSWTPTRTRAISVDPVVPPSPAAPRTVRTASADQDDGVQATGSSGDGRGPSARLAQSLGAVLSPESSPPPLQVVPRERVTVGPPPVGAARVVAPDVRPRIPSRRGGGGRPG